MTTTTQTTDLADAENELAVMRAELDAMQAKLDAANAKLAQKATAKAITFKVSDKGALSAYGLGRFPVTLYASQWERLAAHMDELQAFMKANEGLLTRKD